VCEAAEPASSVKTVDKNRRNRHETRTITVFDATAAVAETEWQSHVAAIIQVERNVIVRQADTGLWKRSLETSIYLSNREVTAKIAADAIRKHWGIENKSHYTRDVTFREDASRIRKNPGIFARLRSIAYNVLRSSQSDTIPQDRFAAALGGLDAVLAMVFSRER
jgi:predicted transposase YbfD/YdcC